MPTKLTKLLVATALISASTFALAYDEAEMFANNMSGPYVGAGISYNLNQITNFPKSFNFDTFTFRTGTVNFNGVAGELFTGYGFNVTNDFYTALELFGTLSSAKTTANIYIEDCPLCAVPFQLKEKYTYGARFMPGVKITDNTLLFGNIGYVRGAFNGAISLPGGESETEKRNGVQFGTGLQAKIAQQVSLRGGWNRNYYQKFNDTEARPITDQFYLSAIFHF